VCLIAKNNHNLSVASKLGLVGKLLRYYRFSSDGYIRGTVGGPCLAVLIRSPP